MGADGITEWGWKLVPPIINSNYNLRKTRKFRVPVAKTKRFAESFIMKGAQLA